MAEFLQAQLDYIVFFHGLAFILLGAACLGIGARRTRDLPWNLLGAFGLAHGANEWLDLAAFSAGDTPAFASSRVVIMTASFALLAEFARLGAARLGGSVPGRWVHAPALALVALAWAAAGSAAAAALARYVLCLVGGAGAGAVLMLYSRALPAAEKRWTLLAAAGFALYGLAAGAVAPAAPFVPLDDNAFLRATGVPVQLVRGVLASWLVVSLWGLRQSRLLADGSSVPYARQLRVQSAWTLLAFVLTLGAGWLLTDYLGRRAEQDMRDQVRSDLNLLANQLRMETGAAESVARAMADSPWVGSALAGSAAGKSSVADRLVDAFSRAAGEAAITYLMDANGTVVSSSNRFAVDSLVGKSDRLRPYFRRAIAGNCTHYYARGVTTGERGYYAGCPVRDASARAVGVAVVKKTLDALESDFRQFERTFFIDPNGVVFLASDSQALSGTLWPLAPETLRALERSRQFGELRVAPVIEREVEDGTWVSLQGVRHYVGRRYIGDELWSFLSLRSGTSVAASRAFGIVVVLLFAVLSMVYRAAIEQLLRDKMALAQRIALEQRAHELDLRAGTDALTGVANRMRFDEVLAEEIARAERYGTPVSLVMCDIDHFKAVNDTHGHPAGDRVLVELCRRITRNTRKTDLLARWGGEEFLVLARNCTVGDASRLAEKLRRVVESGAFEGVGRLTCSFGVAQFDKGESAGLMLARADAALYRAKANGRNRVETA